MASAGSIGVFDSGVGGLAVAAAVRRLLPNEAIVYFADTANFPYGPRPAHEVERLSFAATELLLNHGAKLVVVACNTASSAALAALRARWPDVTFVGMVPAVKPASAATQSRRVGVLATAGTLQGRVLDDLVQQFAHDVEVERVAAPELADLVEHGDLTSDEAAVLVRRFVEPLLARDVDVLVLGCSHFAFLRPSVEALAGPGVQVLDTAEAVARRVAQVLAEQDLASPSGEPSFTCITSGDRGALARSLARLRRAAPTLLPEIDAIEAVAVPKASAEAGSR